VAKKTIHLKRVYEAPDKQDGYRILVDRIWPRGLSKEVAAVDLWLRDLAPSTALRKWFGHDPARWTEFKRRYMQELNGEEASAALAQFHAVKNTRVTLLFAAKDTEHNNAVALQEYLGSGSR
jgi:uncharacterized protein YeaO (DUF488 family)